MDYMEFKNQMLAEIEERLTEKEYACYEPADGNMLERKSGDPGRKRADKIWCDYDKHVPGL